MPRYKLYYFETRGRCELSRMILSFAGIEFEDIRYDDDAWLAAKATGAFPGNQIPALEIDGVKYGQSLAIARYLARETGLVGDTSLDQLKSDGIVDSIYDLLNKVLEREFDCKSAESKQSIWNEISTIVAPRVFKNLDKVLAGPYFLGENISWADLAFLDACQTFDTDNVTQFMTVFPRLLELRQRLKDHPKIAYYLSKQPLSPW